MPLLGRTFSREVNRALALPQAGELARTSLRPDSAAWKGLHVSRLEMLYEMAFLRIFISWEVFLEHTFYRYLCGFASQFGRANTTGCSHYRTLDAAENAVLGSRDYVLWHNPQVVIQRSREFMVNGLHEFVLSSNYSRLEDFAAIRHRIAHGQKDAKQKFDRATMDLCGRRYAGSAPGRFLRDWDKTSVPQVRWLASIGAELESLAFQIV